MKKISSALISAGLVLIFAAFAIFAFTFYRVISEEILYQLNRSKPIPAVSLVAEGDQIAPIDSEFGIVIPKIRANSKVIADVDPNSSRVYQAALTKGVAHAKGSALPGSGGNMFLFSHSSVNFFEASRYNSIFYLLSKLEKGDEVYIFYKGEKFLYKVIEKKTVSASEVSYLSPKADWERLTLMTCTPPGTTFRRLLVIAELVGN